MILKKNAPSTHIWSWLAVSRILIGLTFLWAFLDKLFGLGFSTSSDKSWLQGGSPTTGFLNTVQGPFADFYHSLAGHTLIDVVFMAGLLGIGMALTLGVAVRIGVVSAVAMYGFMWLASFPLETNPVIDDHVINASILLVVIFALPFQRFSLQKQWQSLPTVKKNPWLW